MLLVITGASFTGKRTLATKIVEKLPDVVLLDIDTTCVTERTGYRQVDGDVFSENADDYIMFPSDDGNKYGISKKHLDIECQDATKVVVIVCRYNDALILSRYAPRLNISSVCAYLHCRQSELLQRLCDSNAPASQCYMQVQSIYRNHNLDYLKLENLSINSNGFTSVLRINSGASPIEFYTSMIIDPLMAIIESFSVYKNMRKLCNVQHTLGVTNYAN